jgi:intracellular multiplication protein IcmK
MIPTRIALWCCLVAPVAFAERGDDDTYQDAVDEVLNFTPEQIRDFKKQTDAVGRAIGSLPRGPFKIRNRSVQLSLSPTASTPTLSLFPNMATTVVILDATGQPWPIEKIGVSGTQGNTDYASALQIGIATVLVSSAIHNSYGTLDLKLKNLDRTVKLLFTHGWGNTTVDGQVEIHLDAMGPLAAPEAETAQTLPTVDPALMDFLNETPPAEASELAVKGDLSARAWAYKGKVVLLTQCHLISPNPIPHNLSPNGRSQVL